MTRRSSLRIGSLALALTAGMLGGCRHDVVVPRMGFIPESVQLERDPRDSGTGTYRAAGFNRALYTKIVVEPVVLYPAAAAAVSGADAATVRQVLTNALMTAMGPSAILGPAPVAGDTLVVHAAITELRPSNPLLNIAPQTQMRRRGYGYASVEMLVRAGEFGPVVAAYMNTADTQRLSTEKFSPLGTAERAAGDWANGLAALLK